MSHEHDHDHDDDVLAQWILEFESKMVAGKDELIATGGTPDDLRRAASLWVKPVIDSSEITSRTRAALVPIFDRVFGDAMPPDLRARVAADVVAFRSLKAGGYSDEEIEQRLIRGHSAVKQVIHRQHGVRLTSTEGRLQLDHWLAALAIEPLRHLGE